jgi:predicted secreted Zn-dependent protease
MKRAWLLAPALFMAGQAKAVDTALYEGIPDIRFEYYDVEGRTGREIYQSMRDRAPGTGDGLAQTVWQIDVNWHEQTRGSSCRVIGPRTNLSITVILPRLRQIEDMTPEAMRFWRATRRGLEIHEAGHARIAWDHRDDFNRAALKASCKSIKQVAKTTQDRIVAIQQEYDRVTNHGRSQTPAY